MNYELYIANESGCWFELLYDLFFCHFPKENKNQNTNSIILSELSKGKTRPFGSPLRKRSTNSDGVNSTVLARIFRGTRFPLFNLALVIFDNFFARTWLVLPSGTKWRINLNHLLHVVLPSQFSSIGKKRVLLDSRATDFLAYIPILSGVPGKLRM